MTTRLQIHGTEYDLEHATSRTALNVLIYMKKRLGIGLPAVINGLSRLTAADPMELLGDEDALEAIQGLIWLVRTDAGERGPDGSFLTLEDATDGLSILDLEFLNDDEDVDASGPKELEPAAAASSS